MPSETKQSRLLNLGCGSCFHQAWINIDFYPFNPAIKVCNLLKRMPFPDSTFDAVYHSHLLEHLPKDYALPFLKDCFRILKSQGVIRVVVPDLEKIVQQYSKWLNLAISGDRMAQENYQWILLEMYDQAVRNAGGGEMKRYLLREDLINEEFIRLRIGEGMDIRLNPESRHQSFWQRIRGYGILRLLRHARLELAYFVLGLIGGGEARLALREGLFRRSGEIHCWMYDRFSLSELLAQAGFQDIQVCRADESRIPDFNSYELDVKDGKVRKPDSLFMEAIKP